MKRALWLASLVACVLLIGAGWPSRAPLVSPAFGACGSTIALTGAGCGAPGGGAATACVTLIAGVSTTIVGCWDADQGIVKTGASVTSWTDGSANAYVEGLNSVAGESAPVSPTFGAATFGGKAGVTFVNLSGQYLATTSAAVSFGSNQPGFFISAIITSLSPNFGRVTSFTANGQTTDFNNATSIAAIVGLTAPAFEMVQNGSNIPASAISLNTPSRLAVICDNVNCSTYLNNVAGTPQAASFTLGATGQISIGDGAGSGGLPCDCTIRRYVVTKGAVSSGDRSTIDTFLQN